MNTYLAIITTALVATQIVRVIQNQISLRKQNDGHRTLWDNHNAHSHSNKHVGDAEPISKRVARLAETGGVRMTLWDMLDKTKYYQKVWIFETNAYDQNMPLFKGTVQDARQDTDRVWDFLMCEVETYDCEGGLLDIRVRDRYYNERLEGHYFISSDRWGDAIETRPWRHSSEIDMAKGAFKNGNQT